MAIEIQTLSIPMASYNSVNGEFTYDLDSAVSTGDSLGTVASNKLTLPAGTYSFEGTGCAANTGDAAMKVYDVTSGSSLLEKGTWFYSNSINNVVNPGVLTGKYTFGSSVDIEFRIEADVATTNAYGNIANAAYGNSAQFIITKYT